MNVYAIELEVLFKPFGQKGRYWKHLGPLHVQAENAALALKKAAKFAMDKKGWDNGVPMKTQLYDFKKLCVMDIL